MPPHCRKMNAFAERWVRTVKEECLSKCVLLGEGSHRVVLTQFSEHNHTERKYLGRENRMFFPAEATEAGRRLARFDFGNASAGCSTSTTRRLDEFFDPTG